MILNELSLKNINNENDMIKKMTDFLGLCKKWQFWKGKSGTSTGLPEKNSSG